MNIKLGSYQVADKNVKIKKNITKNINDMLDDFKKEEGKNDIIITSGYRSYQTQEKLLEESIKQYGEYEAKKRVASSGNSEHHTGLAIDFGLYYKNGTSNNYTGEGIYEWIEQNSYKYGFIRRYKNEKESLTNIIDEPWHFRYVGNVHAYYMYNNNLCFEEYIELIKNYGYDNRLETTDYDGKQYNIYYMKYDEQKHTIIVPKDVDYTVSGNNIDGFIITIKL